MKSEKLNLKEYYQQNKDWLQEIAQCGDPVVRAMALVILKRGAPQEYRQDCNFARGIDRDE